MSSINRLDRESVNQRRSAKIDAAFSIVLNQYKISGELFLVRDVIKLINGLLEKQGARPLSATETQADGAIDTLMYTALRNKSIIIDHGAGFRFPDPAITR
jgi:hypothetical protein